MKAHRPCPKCGKLNHVKKKVCECGFEFPIKNKSLDTNAKPIKKQEPLAVKTTESNGATQHSTLRVVLAAAGLSPLKLENSEPETITEWTKNVRNIGTHKGVYYTNSALSNWITFMYLPFDETRKIKRYIMDNILEENLQING